MEVLVSLALLVLGAVIGFFVGRYVQGKQGETTAAVAEQNVKEILAQQAEHHVYQSRQALATIEEQCASLKRQLDDYENLLAKGDKDEAPQVPFFGEQATIYLRNNLNSKNDSKKTQVSDAQPKDFANSGSGLFVGGSEQSAEEKA